MTTTEQAPAAAAPPATSPSRTKPAPVLPTTRVQHAVPTWPTVLLEGPPETSGTHALALALATDERIGEVIWIDWSSGQGEEWVAGTAVQLLPRPTPLENWGTQLKMVSKVAEYARYHLDTVSTPIALVVDCMSAVWAEQRRWARGQVNQTPENKANLRRYPGLKVPIPSNLWDELEERTSDLLAEFNGVPGITVLLGRGSLRLTDSEGASLPFPEYKVDAHRLVSARVHAHLRVDDTGTARAIKVPPSCRGNVDPKAPFTSVADLIFDDYGLDPGTARHHTGYF